jgi:ribose transport system permease protein
VPISGLPPGFRGVVAGSLLGVPMPVVIAALAYLVTHVFLSRTVYGRDLYAIGGNREAARLCGIPVDRRLNLAYALSGASAALAAVVLAARMNSGFPLAGTGAELDAIAAVIIGGASFFGGVGTVGGTLIGALIIGFLRNGLNLLDVSAFWQMIVIGVVIVVAVWIDVLRQRVGRAA